MRRQVRPVASLDVKGLTDTDFKGRRPKSGSFGSFGVGRVFISHRTGLPYYSEAECVKKESINK